jgi:predicted ATPase
MQSREIAKLKKAFERGDFPQHLDWIEIQNIRGWTGERIEFRFPIVCISGENGVGKSTILQSIAASFQPKTDSRTNFYASAFFPDTAWEKITGATIKGEVKRGTDRIAYSIRRPTERWLGNPERIKRDVVLVDLRRVQPLYAKIGYQKIAAGATREVSNREYSPELLERLKNVVGKAYAKAKMGTTDVSADREVPVVEVNGVSYSGFHQGAGETTIVELLSTDIPKYSIVVIDEVETSLHPRAQRRLIRDLADYARERHVQFILTTHSPFVMDELPPEARIHILLTEGKRTVVSGVSPEFALSKMDDERHPELDVYVEDDRAKILVEEIIQAKSREHLLRMDVLPYGSASVGKSLGMMRSESRFKKPTVVILDGDQDPAPGCSLLPGEDAPERVVFERLSAAGWPNVATRIERSHSDLVDAANAAMTLPNHHDWVRHVADKVVVGGNELWRAMSRSYIAVESPQAFVPLVDAIQSAFADGAQ